MLVGQRLMKETGDIIHNRMNNNEVDVLISKEQQLPIILFELGKKTFFKNMNTLCYQNNVVLNDNSSSHYDCVLSAKRQKNY